MKKIEFKYALMRKGHKYKAQVAGKLYDVNWTAPHYSSMKRIVIKHDDPNIAEKLARTEIREKLKNKWTGFRMVSKEIIDDTREHQIQ
jgi:hypothetical protein